MHPFFHTILNVSQETNHLNEIHDQLNIGSDLITMDEAMNFIDKIVEVDFLEPIPIDWSVKIQSFYVYIPSAYKISISRLIY